MTVTKSTVAKMPKYAPDPLEKEVIRSNNTRVGKEKYAIFVGKILSRSKVSYTSNKQELL